LVVEDDPPSLELMAEVFGTLKAEVCAVGDSRQAAELIRQEKFDGIFVDLEMPHLHGLDLARHIRYSGWNKSTPIVVVTGRDDRNTMQQAFATGATFFLQKPVDRQKLTGLFRTVRGTMLQNHQRLTRVPLQVSVACSVGSQNASCQSRDLSQGGMQLEGENLKFGDLVQVCFRLPGSHSDIQAFGLVIWLKGQRAGVKFTKLDYKSEKEIRDFIAQQQKLD
jgi:CheY-like chemotaxis protein